MCRPRAAPAAEKSEPPSFVLIVNRANPENTITRRAAEDLFLKRTRRWPDGPAAMPVDLPPESPVRRDFCRRVLGRPVSMVLGYWRAQIFSGRGVPPPELASSHLVMKAVAADPGGIGYVERGLSLELPATVKIILVVD